MSFDENFKGLVQLKKDRIESDLQTQRLDNERTRFELDRAKGLAPPLNRYANGGQIQDVSPKGFAPVPVRVSNGEYEFTPEQVAAIGAALLASKNQQPPVGFDAT